MTAIPTTSRVDGRRTLRAGGGEPLVLLHGLHGSAAHFRRVVPLLSPHHLVVAPTQLGHHGGRPALSRPVRISHVVDDMEACLDELGHDKVHLAGNSMGGWVALELARRGRALSVCALSPAGAWEVSSKEPAGGLLRRSVSHARLARNLLPLVAGARWVRRYALRDMSVHGERVSARELTGIVTDALGCTVSEDLLSTPESLAPLSCDCPITLAWSAHDQLFPVHVNGHRARELVPEARFTVLDGVGHVPMFDDPQLVADTILRSTALAMRRPRL